MKRRLSSVKERRDMRFADQPHHDGSILYVSNLSPTLGETVTLWVRAPRMAGIGTVHVRALRDGEQYFSQAVIDPDRTPLPTDGPPRPVSGYGSDDTWWRATASEVRRSERKAARAPMLLGA